MSRKRLLRVDDKIFIDAKEIFFKHQERGFIIPMEDAYTLAKLKHWQKNNVMGVNPKKQRDYFKDFFGGGGL